MDHMMEVLKTLPLAPDLIFDNSCGVIVYEKDPSLKTSIWDQIWNISNRLDSR